SPVPVQDSAIGPPIRGPRRTRTGTGSSPPLHWLVVGDVVGCEEVEGVADGDGDAGDGGGGGIEGRSRTGGGRPAGRLGWGVLVSGVGRAEARPYTWSAAEPAAFD